MPKANLWAKAKSKGVGAKNANAPKHKAARKAPAGDGHMNKKKK